MTRLEANLKDLKILYGECGEPVCWEFRFSKCDSLKETIGDLKSRIPAHHREYHKDYEGYVWRVTYNTHNRIALTQVFDNYPIWEEILSTVAAKRQKGNP